MSKYIKPDCELGYIEDNAEIDYLKFNNMRHTVLGCMLGDFNEQGEYVVESEIVKELISMPKYIIETMDNIDVCVSEIKLDKQISYLVTFEEDKATLSLIEKLSFEANFKLNSGTYSNINEYILDEVQTSGEINRNVLYARWNISQYPGNVIDIFSCDDGVLEKYFGIVNRFKYLLTANKILLDKEEDLEEIESEYAVEIFNILKHYPKLEKAVMKEFVKTLNEKKDFITPEKPNFAKTANELLDKLIEENQKELTEEEKTEFKAEQRNVKVNSIVKKKDLIDTQLKINESEKENSVIRIKTPELHNPLLEIAQAYIAAQKAVENRYKKKSDKQADKSKTPNKDKLVASMIGAGVGFAVAGVGGAVAGVVAGAVAADAAKKADEATKPKTASADGKSKSASGEKSKGDGGSGKGTNAKANNQKPKPTPQNQNDESKEKDKSNLVDKTAKRK